MSLSRRSIPGRSVSYAPRSVLSAGLFLLVSTGSVSLLFTVVAFWWLVDVLLAPGAWCHNLCPTGFLLEQVGRFSLVALRKRGEEPCPESCDVACAPAPTSSHGENRPTGPCAMAVVAARRCARRSAWSAICPSSRARSSRSARAATPACSRAPTTPFTGTSGEPEISG